MLRCLCGLLLLLPIWANAMERIEVGEVRFAEASLTVSGPAGEETYDPATLETFGTYAVETITPWRETPVQFIGIRLQDLLTVHGIADAPAIRVTAENDYAVTIDRDSWTEHDLLVATRVDGKPHTRRARGPFQFVFDMSNDPSVGSKAFEGNWVWMAARIEPVD